MVGLWKIGRAVPKDWPGSMPVTAFRYASLTSGWVGCSRWGIAYGYDGMVSSMLAMKASGTQMQIAASFIKRTPMRRNPLS